LEKVPYTTDLYREKAKRVRRGGSIYAFIALLMVFLIVDIGLVTWLVAPPLRRTYVVQPGDSLASIAQRFRVHEQSILQENSLLPGSLLEPGQSLSITMHPLEPLRQWRLHLIGLAVTVIGVAVGLWLLGIGGLLPQGTEVPFLLSALAVAVSGYVTAHVLSRNLLTDTTPLSLLHAVRDGFAWTVMLLLLSRALGFGAAPAQSEP